MSRGAKPKPPAPHGTYASFVGRPAAGIKGCRCAPCTEAGRLYCARRNLLQGTGRPLTVSSEAAAAHLRRLFDGGASWPLLVKVSGCSTSLLQAVLGGRSMIHRRSEARILAVRLEQVISAQRLVPALGAIRRARALVAIGHPIVVVANAGGLGDEVLTLLLAGEVTEIKARTHDAVKRAFTTLAMVPGTSTRSLNRARREGWDPPLAWDDIDDPDEQPKYGEGGLRREAIVEDTAELAALGLPRNVIADRLGLTWPSIARAHERTGTPLPELAA